MIEIEMSRDIQDFSPKVISFLTKRQVICLAIAAAYGIPLFMLLGDMSMTTKFSIVTVAIFPTLACGWVKMYGMPLEKFFIKSILPMYFSPRKRKYVTKDTYGFENPEKEKERLVTFKDIQPKKLKRKERREKREMYKKHNAKI